MKRTITDVLKIIAAVLLISMLLFLVAYFSVLDPFHMGKLRLSVMNEALCKDFLLKQGVTISEEFSNLDFQQLIALFEAIPNGSTATGYAPYGDLLQEIKDVVNAYYGIEP